MRKSKEYNNAVKIVSDVFVAIFKENKVRKKEFPYFIDDVILEASIKLKVKEFEHG